MPCLLNSETYLRLHSFPFDNYQLNVNAALSVLLSSFTGFGIAISTNSLLVECLRWRANRRQRQTQPNYADRDPQDRHRREAQQEESPNQAYPQQSTPVQSSEAPESPMRQQETSMRGGS